MRFHRQASIVISEDDSTTPKDVRFKVDSEETTDTGATATLKDAMSHTVSVPAGAVDFLLPLPQVTTGKYLYLRANAAWKLKLNGMTADLDMLANKINELWCDFTTVKISNPGLAALRLTWAIGGD
jgi:hypothetical protein